MRYSELIENTDDDLFSKPGELSTNIKQSIKQIQNPYQRTVHRVRDIAKNQFGVKVRVSAQPTKAARGTAVFWFGDYVRDSDDEPPQAPPVAHEIKAELESQGFECKFTGSGWLSVRVPLPFSNILDESDDDELFGDPVHRRIGQWLMGFANTMRNNPAEISGLDPSDGEEYDSDLEDIREEAKTLKQVADAFIRQGMQAGLIMWQDNSEDWWWERIAAELEEETDISLEQLFDEHGMNESAETDNDMFATPKVAFNDVFNEYDEDKLMAQGFQYGDHPEQDIEILNNYLEDYKNFRVVGITGGEHDLILHLDRSSRLRETDDDELFAQKWHERIDMSSIEIDGVDRSDYPDFVDAHVSYAQYKNGAALDELELEKLNNYLTDNGQLHELVWNSLYEDKHAL
jgi:hypothetical protein